MHLAAVFDRPATGLLMVAIICAASGCALHWWFEFSTRPERAEPHGEQRPEPIDGQTIEQPAVVGLLTNEFTAPHSAVTATSLDLAARGWIRLTSTDGELVIVTRGTPSRGDSLLPFEQQVLNHLTARAFNDVSSASTLALSHHRLNRRWWLRFQRSVGDEAQTRGLSTPRYTPVELAPPAVLTGIALLTWWFAGRNGDDVALSASWQSRTIWVLTLGAIAGLGWVTALRFLGGAQRPTALGRDRQNAWMGFRQRLRERIPTGASVLAPPTQQRALSQACVMGGGDPGTGRVPGGARTPPARLVRRWWCPPPGPHPVSVPARIRPASGQGGRGRVGRVPGGPLAPGVSSADRRR